MIIDIHTHAFPDAIAEKAVRALEEEANITAHLDGKISSLLKSMDEAGIDISVVASVCAKPSQFRSILDWAKKVASNRILPFPSVHPADPHAVDQIGEIAKCGFLGVKLHPYYQEFVIDEPEFNPLYERIQREGLVLLMHTGFDPAFPENRIADPKRTDAIIHRFPDLKFIASHFGARGDWGEVERHLIGKKVYIDTSYAMPDLDPERARKMLVNHDRRYFLFGSDSPWGNQASDLETLRGFGLGEDYTANLLGGNAAKLLNLAT